MKDWVEFVQLLLNWVKSSKTCLKWVKHQFNNPANFYVNTMYFGWVFNDLLFYHILLLCVGWHSDATVDTCTGLEILTFFSNVNCNNYWTKTNFEISFKVVLFYGTIPCSNIEIDRTLPLKLGQIDVKLGQIEPNWVRLTQIHTIWPNLTKFD